MAGEQYLREFFNTRMDLEESIVRTFATGGSGMSSRWWKVIVELSKMGHRFSIDFMQEIEAYHQTPIGQAKEAMSRLKGRCITAAQLAAACDSALLQLTATDIRNAIMGLPCRFTDTPLQAMIRFDSSPAPYTAVPVSRKRLVSPIDKLEDDCHLVIKAPFCDEEARLKNLSLEVVGIYKGYAAAKNEANEMLDEDIKNVGGDEGKLQHLYTVWSMRAHVSGERRQVKDRTREIKK